jgi:hypothetical protein
MNLKPEDRVYWRDKINGKTQTGVLVWRGKISIIEPHLTDFRTLQEDDAIKWEILGDDGLTYIIEEVRLKMVIKHEKQDN